MNAWGLIMRRKYNSRSEEKKEIIWKNTIRFQKLSALFDVKNITELEILKINLLRAYHENKLKNSQHSSNIILSKILDSFNQPSTSIISKNDSKDIEELFHTNQRARRYLMLFKDHCSDNLKKIIFDYELNKCFEDARNPEKKRLIAQLQTCLNEGVPCVFTETEYNQLNSARTERCLIHFESLWRPYVQIKMPDVLEEGVEMSKKNKVQENPEEVQPENTLTDNNTPISEHPNTSQNRYNSLAGRIALFIYKENKSLVASFSRWFSNTYAQKKLSYGKRNACDFIENYFINNNFNTLMQSSSDAGSYCFIDALSSGELGGIRDTYLPSNATIAKKNPRFQGHLDAHERERIRELERLAAESGAPLPYNLHH
jgi:hypothetical protein